MMCAAPARIAEPLAARRPKGKYKGFLICSFFPDGRTLELRVFVERVHEIAPHKDPKEHHSRRSRRLISKPACVLSVGPFHQSPAGSTLIVVLRRENRLVSRFHLVDAAV